MLQGTMSEPGAEITEPYVLPSDVVLSPAGLLPSEVRRRLAPALGDVVLSRRGSRAPASLVGSGAAALLSRFRTPTRIAEAVARHALEHRTDAQSVLIEAFPLLRRLIDSRLLVPASSTGALAL